MNVFLDFDGTLFDTARHKRHTREIFLQGGVTEERFNETYRQLAEGAGYHPVEQARLLARDWRDETAKHEALTRVMAMLADGAACVMPGMVEVLKGLRHRGDRLILLTRGNQTWQEAKLACSGLMPLLDAVEISVDLKAGRLMDLTEPLDDGIVIDDSPSELVAMMAVRPRLRYIHFRLPENLFEAPYCEVATSVTELKRLLDLHA